MTVRDLLIQRQQRLWDGFDFETLERMFRACVLCDEALPGLGEAMPVLSGTPGGWRCFGRRDCEIRAVSRLIEAASRVGPGVGYVTQMVFSTVPGGPVAMIEAARR
jgi:hypothetical protein